MHTKLPNKELLEKTSDIVVQNKLMYNLFINIKISSLFLVGIILFNSQNLFSQENSKQENNNKHVIDKIYYYNKTTDNALIELQQLVAGDKIKLDKILTEISELEKSGKIVLSTKEFEPIKLKIDNFYANSTLQGEEYSNSKKYAEMVYYTYVVITDLIIDKK